MSFIAAQTVEINKYRMQKSYFHISLLTFFLLLNIHSSAQEIISELKFNDALIFEKHHSQLRFIDTLQLPFNDDFSYSQLDPKHKYPDQNLWMDKDCFVNTTYPILPPSIGVATFDGLNEKGEPYDPSASTQIDLSSSYPADSLTSLPIDMHSISVADSVYLSFFYEKMGIGDYPNVGDKLLLELKKNDGTWNEVWEMDGDASLPTVIKFRQIMIPIIDAAYFFNGFQFRFRNNATTSGNNDHWHIDYVRLDSSRSYSDTLIRDVAAVYTPGTILNKYQFMPWTQFRNNQSTELAATFPFVVHNMSSIAFNANNKYSASEYFSPYSQNIMFSNGVGNSFNFSSGSFLTQNNLTGNDTASISGDSALLLIKCLIKSDSTDKNLRNDTAYRVQPFYNFYAHDDGSAEKAYALYGAGSKLAYNFYSNIPDTLRAVQIHFALITTDFSNKFLSIMLWKSVLPTEQLQYEQDFLQPTYIDSINGFATYILDTPQAIVDTFLVGWLQTYPEYLNVGLDKNTDSHQYVFYQTSVNPTFVQSTAIGSIMIRPLVGTKLPYTSAQNILINTISVNCFPNPVDDVLHVNVKGINHAELFITDLTGRTIQISEGTDENIFVGNLSPGMYLLTVKDKLSKQSFTTRFIKL
ncbi:MAG: T9SS C-terminal target domain-containing protein [Sphingobacteriales bacterium]|nr:MAG: T9SS C-terminal target domain-containing protein [Sphingobacteriales bacterium]